MTKRIASNSMPNTTLTPELRIWNKKADCVAVVFRIVFILMLTITYQLKSREFIVQAKLCDL
jgi:hypothetical protein